MIIGLIVIWVSMLVYVIVLFKQKLIHKKERKWVYLLIAIAMVLSILDSLHITLNFVVTFLNNSFGKISGMVVNK